MEALRTYIEATGFESTAAAARALGISRPHLHGILAGKDVPSRKLILRIEALTEGAVGWADWRPQAPA